MRRFLSLLLVLGVAVAAPAVAKPEASPEFPVVAPDKPEAAAESTAAGPSPTESAQAWLGRLASSGVPGWAWGLGGALGLILLRRLFRRPERDDDLMGPPRPARYRDLPRY